MLGRVFRKSGRGERRFLFVVIGSITNNHRDFLRSIEERATTDPEDLPVRRLHELCYHVYL